MVFEELYMEALKSVFYNEIVEMNPSETQAYLELKKLELAEGGREKIIEAYLEKTREILR